MLTLIRRKKMFPSRLMRFCTQQLKIFPIRDHIRVLQDRGDEVVSAVGVRADESAARAAMAEWEFWDEMDAEIWRPLIRWSEQDVIDVHRRHGMPPNPLYLPPPLSCLFAVGIARGEELVGVAIVGRPVARALQDGGTAEVTRVCTEGERNGCSMLLAACRRGAHALGYRRLITYTLTSEPGTSLRAAGWQEVAKVRGRSWSCSSRPRPPNAARDKRRWEAPVTGHASSVQRISSKESV